MGWPLALSVFCGFVMAVALQVSRPFLTKMDERLKINYDAALLLLVWIIAIYGTTAGLMVKYPRYLIPIYPQLFVFAAIFLFWCGVKLSNFYQRDRG